MATARVAIVSDSAAALPMAAQTDYRIVVAPLRLTIGGQEFLEGVNISPPRVMAALLAGERVAVKQPSVADFAAIYTRLSDAGASHVVSIHLSARMHDAAGNAREAAAAARVPVSVMDTGAVAMAQGFVALAAAAVAREGAEAAEVEAAAAATQAGARLMFTVATMDYLFRDGQVPRVLKAFSNATNVRPLLSVVDGEVKMVGRVRGTDPARERVRDEMTEYAGSLSRPAVAVSLVGASAADAGLAIDLAGAIDESSAGASLTAHAGPGTYVVAVAPMPPEYVL